MVRVRFAPSPTGNIHIGNVRAALFNYVFAKKHGGKLILRLEDTDLERSSEESAQGIVDDLKWLGIEFDEGPHIGGDNGPYRCMERLNIYREYAEKLLTEGKAVKDFSHNEDNASDNDSYAIRLKAGCLAKVHDLVFGNVEKEQDDFIILKSNGIPTYHLAVVVDDHLMEISHVIRGQDHLDNTFKHALLHEALGWKPPVYAHYSLTFGLSKRDESKSIRFLKDQGYLPEAILNVAMLLGWASKSGDEKFNISDILEEFDPKDFNKANSHFDEEKFNWLAGQYIREASTDRLCELAIPFLKKSRLIIDNVDQDYIKQVIDVVKVKIKCVAEIVDHVGYFFNDIVLSDEAKAIVESGDAQTVLKCLLEKVKASSSLDADNFNPLLKEVQKETKIKGKNLFMPVRIAITGELHGPEMNLIAPVLGKETCTKRLESIIK